MALALRLVMARVFFLDGQTRIDGPHLAYSFHGFDVSVILPMQVKAETLSTFLSHYAALPIPGAVAAYLVGYAEFLLPLMLVLGFGTRIAALGLMIMTAMIQVFVHAAGAVDDAYLLGGDPAGAAGARSRARFRSTTSSVCWRGGEPWGRGAR